MSPVETKILDKIKKCLAVGNNAGATPDEANAALCRAQEMMAKYGISAEVLANKVTPDEVIEAGVRSCATASKCKPWELRLYRTIATAFGCELLFSRGASVGWIHATGGADSLKYATYQFIGLREEAQVARYVAEVLQRQLCRCRSSFTRTLADYLARGEKTARVDSYCEGWVKGASTKVEPLSARRQAAAKAAEADGSASPGTALAVVSKEEQALRAVADYLKAHASGKSTGSQNRRAHYGEYAEQGYQDGLRAEVNRAIGSTTTTVQRFQAA